MKTPFPLFLGLLLLFFSSCSDKDSNEDQPELEEKILPVLSVENLESGSSIETYTDFMVSVLDDAEVTTKIYINEQEVFETTNNEFNYNFNPYKVPVGPTLIRFETVDADNNVVEEVFMVELKHLLLTTDIANHQINGEEIIWDTVHDLDGNALAAEKMVLGLNKIYTDEVIQDEYMYYSRIYYEDSDSRFRRVATAYTYTMKLGVHRSILDEVRLNLPNTNTFRLTVEGLAETDFITHYEAVGTKYETPTFGGGQSTNGFSVYADTGFEDNTDKLFYTNQSYLVVEENGGTGKKEDYRYFVVDNPQDGMNIVLERDDFSSLSSSFRLDLPQDKTSYNISRFGFETEQDLPLKTYNNHRIFSHGNPSVTYVDLPIFEMFQYYRNYVFYIDPVTNYRNTFVTFGNEVNLEEINGQITYNPSDNALSVSTTAQNTDVLRVSYGGIEDTNGDNYWDNFNWYYRLDPRLGEQSQVVLTLPQAVKDDFSNNFLFDQDLRLESADVIDYEKIVDYDDFIFTFILEERDDPLENGYRIKALPNQANNTSKESRTGLVKELDAHVLE